MASPMKKSMNKTETHFKLIRKAVCQALIENKANILLDGRPCSIEIGKNAKKELTWNVKIYTLDVHEALDTVSMIRKIEDAINDKFKNG